MSQLCSAYLSRMNTESRSMKKSGDVHNPPSYQGSFGTARGDRLYSSLRDRPRRKAGLSDISYKTVTFTLPESETKPASTRRVSWASSERIIDVFCQPDSRHLRHSFRDTSSRKQSKARYPRSVAELDFSLSVATSLHPANIPVVVAQGYTPQAKEEVQVQEGTIVNCMYKSGKWVFVTTPEEKSGYIPAKCIQKIGPLARDQEKLFRHDPDSYNNRLQGAIDQNNSTSESETSFSSADTTLQGTDTSFTDSAFSETCSFLSAKNDRASKDPPNSLGRLRTGMYFSPRKSLDDLYIDYYTALKDTPAQALSLTVVIGYTALNDDDVSVSAQEVVTSSEEDDDDSDWVWVKKENGQEGYIPRACTVNLGLLNMDPYTRTTYL